MDDAAPALEVGFAIDTGGAFAELLRFSQMFDDKTVQIVRQVAEVERATGGMMQLGPATARITSFGNAATRELQNINREKARTEKTGEALVRQLEKEAAALGKTRDEMRDAKVEAIALAAAQQKNTDLADRLLGAARRRQAAANAVAEAEQAAADKAVAAADREAQARREAAHAHDMFEAAARRGMAAMREQQALEQRLTSETNQLRAALDPMFAAQQRFDGEMQRADRLLAAGTISTREYAAAQDLARDALRQHAAAVTGADVALREQDAAKRAAIASADSYAAKLEAETAAIGRTASELRAMEVAQRAAAAEAAGMPDQAARIRAAGAAYAEAQSQAAGLAAEERRLAAATREAAEAARQAAAAQAAQDASVNALRSAVDPLHSSQMRLQRELENAARLYHAGAIGQDEYARSSAALAAQLDSVQRAQARQNAGPGPARPKLGGSDVANIFAQVNDIGVSLAGGQNPFLVLIQQGSQLQGIMMQTGASVGDMARAVGGLFIVTTPTAAATAALAEAELAQAAAQTAATGANTRAAITAAELAVANEVAAAATLSDATAQRALAAAQAAAAGAAIADAQALAALSAAQAAAAGTASELAASQLAVAAAEAAATGSSEVAAAAARQLAVAQASASTAATDAAASATRSLRPWLATLGEFAVPLAAIGVSLYALNQNMNEKSGLKEYAKTLGLTKDEMKKLGDQSVTAGDMLNGLATTLGFSFDGVGKTIKGWIVDIGNFFGNVMKGIGAAVYGLFVGSYRAIVETWRQFPAVLGDLFVQAVNGAIKALQWLVNKSIDGLNAINPLGQIAHVDFGAVENKYAGAGRKAGAAWARNLNGAVKESLDWQDRKMAELTANTLAASRKRLKGDADKIIADRPDKKDPKPKVDRHAEQLARENEAIEAQIKNLYKLADAYGVSGAAALIAEARVKAESDAIKKRGDVEAFVDRQVRLAIAQRVSDGAKATATMREQAAAQERVNAMVAAGLVPAERAADLVKDQLADLPLLDAIKAAQERQEEARKVGNVARQAEMAEAVRRATGALNDQRLARERLTKSEADARYNSAMSAGGARLAEMREELRLIGATDVARARSMAEFKARQDTATTKGFDPEQLERYVKLQGDVAVQGVLNAQANDAYNASLTETADRWDIIASKVQAAGQGMADAFGSAGRAIGDLASIYANYTADRARAEAEHQAAITKANGSEKLLAQENARFALRSSGAQIQAYGDMVSAAKGFFKEGSSGYKAMAAAEKVYRVAQFAMSVQAMVQNAAETLGFVTSSAAKATAAGAEGVANQSKLPFPANIAAMAATAAALVAAGIAVFGGSGGGTKAAPVTNTGTGTVLGDSSAQSESVKRSIDALKEVDTLMLTASRQMAASLRSIDAQIGGFAAQILKAGDINANAGVTQGFKANAIGSVLGNIPLIGGILKGLFGSTTTVTGSGLFGNAQSLGGILSNGFDASYYSDIQKKSKFLGITTSTKNSTQFTGADPTLENQFTLILREFNDAITAAAGPLGESTDAIQQRLNGFIVNIGKIDLTGLTGDQITEKLTAVFGAAADQMAVGAFPSIARFQKAGEGAFETLVRVASTVEAVTGALDQLGAATAGLGIDAKLGLAGQFDTVGDLTGAVDAYFQAFYTAEEQAAAKAAQFGRVFYSLGLTMPGTLAGFRSLVEAQDLTTAAGQATYATLLQLAPAFAELKSSMDGAKSAADILSERQDLQRKLLELNGDTKAIRALDLMKIDASNRALQEQVWALSDAQDAAKSAQALADAWASVGNSIMDEVKRIRGLTGTDAGGGFASLLGQFNAATAAARGGDQDAAKSLPGLSQALLKAAEEQATSRQELARVQAQTAASLEATYGVISALTRPSSATTANSSGVADASTLSTASSSPAANDDTAASIEDLREELEATRRDLTSALATIASNTGRTARVLDLAQGANGGPELSVAIYSGR